MARITRRNTLIGFGALAIGGGVIVGTGAFDTVEADRTVQVQAAGDDAALLAFEPNEDDDFNPESGISAQDGGDLEPYGGAVSDYVGEEDDTIAFVISGEGNDWDGVNLAATTTFRDLVRVTNNGSQDVGVYIDDENIPTDTDSGEPIFNVLAWDGDDEETVSIVGDSDNAVTVGAGETIGLTIEINLRSYTETSEADGDLPEQITIIADADEA